MSTHEFDEVHLLHELRHYLPAQAPLKDFIHHNTLHSFQSQKFFDGLRDAATIFGYKTTLRLNEYRKLYADNRINKLILQNCIIKSKGNEKLESWLDKALHKQYDESVTPRIGQVYQYWNKEFGIDLETFILPKLFRILCSYLDQGISIWEFPIDTSLGFLDNIRMIECNSVVSFFHSERVKQLLSKEDVTIKELLRILIGKDESLYEQYVFDQQFLHPGWSGMVATIEHFPDTLLINRKISLHDIIVFELLLEIDTLDYRLEGRWKPLGNMIIDKPITLFEQVESTELDEVLRIWQLAFEWSWYDQVLTGFQIEEVKKTHVVNKSFQAIFCIDDRECSIRRYIESFDSQCETFGTPGFFGVEFYFKPNGGKFVTKVCPAPVTPRYLIKEKGDKIAYQRDIHFSKNSHNFLTGWFITQTLGFWSAFKLFASIFYPSMTPAAASSLKHMDKNSSLTIENSEGESEDGLQIGFTVEEMALRVENVLKSMGLVKQFAPIVYVIGHGASSSNNPHYAAYDCGACSGRAGSVNARVFSFMANHTKVRALLAERGIDILENTQFVGGIRDTTRDEIVFFDTNKLNDVNRKFHAENEKVFLKALDYNAKERSRRFASVNSKDTPQNIHKQILQRSVSLFEPRPELNHATNAACIIGRRALSKGLFLDRRSFLNSYDYAVDPDGKYLLGILNAAAPVCGGINLEYYFSRVDNQKLGAGSKLPHNVMGLIGVANGTDGDLRPGLPSQMIEVHDPVRLLMIVEHKPEVVLQTIKINPATYEWFKNEWVVLAVIHPLSKEIFVFNGKQFDLYKPINKHLPMADDIYSLVESHDENFPVYLIK
jgi:uncharacterized protein YbcC (UPF0753/DUF2309 family)